VNRSRFVSVSQRTSRDRGHEWLSLFAGAAVLALPVPHAQPAKTTLFAGGNEVRALRGHCRANGLAAGLASASNLTPVTAEGELLQDVGHTLAHGQEFDLDAALGGDTGYPSSHPQRFGE
jgi:hypothetical protein